MNSTIVCPGCGRLSWPLGFRECVGCGRSIDGLSKFPTVAELATSAVAIDAVRLDRFLPKVIAIVERSVRLAIARKLDRELVGDPDMLTLINNIVMNIDTDEV